jgi:hypothetical protein
MAFATLASISLFAITISAVRADGKIDPAGVWQLKMAIPGRPAMESTLRLEHSGGKIVGVTEFRGRSAPIKDVELKGDELSFHANFSQQGREFKFVYKGKLTSDTFKGKLDADFGGRKFVLPFDGKRQKEDTGLAGAWKLTLHLESGQTIQPTVRLKQQGDIWTGNYIGNSGKDLALEGLKQKGDELSFKVIDTFDGDKVPIAYTGTVKGTTMQGMAKVGSGSQTASLRFEGQKVQISTANIAGTWKLKVPFKPDQVFEPTLKLAQTGSMFNGSYLGEQGETSIADAFVIGDEFTFEVARDKDGKKYKLRYQGKVAGDQMTGTVDYDFDGVIGILDFEGRRAGEAKQ